MVGVGVGRGVEVGVGVGGRVSVGEGTGAGVSGTGVGDGVLALVAVGSGFTVAATLASTIVGVPGVSVGTPPLVGAGGGEQATKTKKDVNKKAPHTFTIETSRTIRTPLLPYLGGSDSA